jgi:hypothetical protein
MAQPDPQGGVTNAILKAVGREQGPDYMLKILPEDLTLVDGRAGASPIFPDSSITELLNVVLYLCSGTRDGNLIDAANSVTNNPDPANSTIGAHDDHGLYAAPGAIGDSFIVTAANNGTALFDLNTLAELAVPVNNAVIPVGILRRTQPAAPPADPSWQVLRAAPSLGRANAVRDIMSDCIKQMINVLFKTREIFGPKGWTDLFQKVKGGGSSRSKNAKRTHRHRRRYSSKQY